MNALQPEPHLALIVEDDRDVRDLAAALLEETPLDVVEVERCGRIGKRSGS
jgi:CheY-like chemotaxis protein